MGKQESTTEKENQRTRRACAILFACHLFASLYLSKSLLARSTFLWHWILNFCIAFLRHFFTYWFTLASVHKSTHSRSRQPGLHSAFSNRSSLLSLILNVVSNFCNSNLNLWHNITQYYGCVDFKKSHFTFGARVGRSTFDRLVDWIEFVSDVAVHVNNKKVAI